MHYITKLNPLLCPLACEEIARRFSNNEVATPPRNFVIFKGLAYVVKANGEIWHVAQVGSIAPYDNTWTDAQFGLTPIVTREDAFPEESGKGFTLVGFEGYTVEHKTNETGEEYTLLLDASGNEVGEQWGHNTLSEMVINLHS